MKKREKPDPSRPQLWYQPGKVAGVSESRDGFGPVFHSVGVWDDYGPRLRIFYPNGKAEWIPIFEENKWDSCCFNYKNTYHKNRLAKSMDQAKKLAKRFDKKEFQTKMRFISNL